VSERRQVLSAFCFVLLLVLFGVAPWLLAQTPRPTPTNAAAAGTGGSCGALGGDVTGTCGANTVVKINGTAFSGTSGHLVSLGASNTPADSGIVATAVTQTIASGTSAMATGAITSGACAAAVTTTATGTATTDNIQADFNADPTSTTGYSPTVNGMLTVIKYPTSGNVNFKVCNNTSASVTPGPVTFNWRVVR
jgi:hypothetical protein